VSEIGRRVETRSLPAFARRYPSRFTLITRSPRRPCASYPSCVAVYPRDCRSRRVLCRRSHQLHCICSLPLASAIRRGFTGHFADSVSSIHSIAGAARHSPQRVNSGQALTAKPYRTELIHHKRLMIYGRAPDPSHRPGYSFHRRHPRQMRD